MARATTAITDIFQQIGSGPVTITVLNQGTGSLFFNETAVESNANVVTGVAGDQYSQTEIKDTYVKSSGEGWVLLTDGSL